MSSAKKKAQVPSGLLSATFRRIDLVRALSAVRGIVSGRGSIPITSAVLLTGEEFGATVEATDLSVFGSHALNGEVSVTGSVAVDAKKLLELVRELPEGDVSINGHENSSVEVRAGRSKVKLLGLAVSDFPKFPAIERDALSFTIDGPILGEMIDRTIFAVADDDTRLQLAGLLFECTAETLTLVGTDGHRLSTYTVPVGSKDRKAIVPREALRIARKAFGDEPVTVRVSQSIASFEGEAWSLCVRLIDAEFPDYAQVMAVSAPVTVEMSRDDLLSSIRRVSVVTSERSRGVAVRVVGDGLEVSASSPDHGEASEVVPMVPIEGSGESSVGLNASYLAGVLDALGGCERVQLSMGSDSTPCVLCVPGLAGWKHVVMPMRM